MHLDLQDGIVALALILAVATLLAAAPTLHIPYPILLVLGGLAIGLVPGMPEFELQPELVFFGVLPPLLYGAAFFTSLRDLRPNARPIGLLAVGLVVVTTVGVAVVAHTFVDGLSVGERVRARRDRVADRPARRDLDRASARGPTQARDDRRGREPRERRDGPRALPRRRRRSRDGLVLDPLHRRALRRRRRWWDRRRPRSSAGSSARFVVA